jgi:hypothetical protein
MHLLRTTIAGSLPGVKQEALISGERLPQKAIQGARGRYRTRFAFPLLETG